MVREPETPVRSWPVAPGGPCPLPEVKRARPSGHEGGMVQERVVAPKDRNERSPWRSRQEGFPVKRFVLRRQLGGNRAWAGILSAMSAPLLDHIDPVDRAPETCADRRPTRHRRVVHESYRLRSVTVWYRLVG